MRLTYFDYVFPNYSNNNNRTMIKYKPFSIIKGNIYCFSVVKDTYYKSFSCITRKIYAASMVTDWQRN